MKKLSFTLLFFLFAICMFAKEVVINNPIVEFTTSGITHVSKIELGKEETRVHIHSIFIPHWWVKFDLYPFIENPDTGEKWNAIRMENGEFDKEIYMPASGDSTFVVIFPPIDRKKVKRLNYGEKDETILYGISLNPKAKQKTHEVPNEVYAWIDEELEKAKVKTPMNLEANDFFKKDTARIIGYINGYKPQAGFKTGIVYTGNVLTREDYPSVVEIFEDGRFECKLPLSYPINSSMWLKDVSIGFYLEPGQTLAVLLDWNEFLLADRYRNRRYVFNDILFIGPLAQVNTEITEAKRRIEPVDARDIYRNGMKKKLEDFIPYIHSMTAKYEQAVGEFIKEKSLQPTTRTVLYYDNIVSKSTYLMDYASDYSYNNKDKEKLPLSFYDFLKEMPLNTTHLLLSNEFSTFINRFEYCDPLWQAHVLYKPEIKDPEKNPEQYLFEELGLKKTKEDEAYYNKEKEVWSSEIRDEQAINEFRKMSQEFRERYAAQLKDYTEKYITPLGNPSELDRIIAIKQLKDSIYMEGLKLQPSLTYEVTKIRELAYTFKGWEREEAKKYLTHLSRAIKHPFLKSEAERIYDHYFPIGEKIAYELPTNNKGSEIFKQIIDSHKGKYVFVDFWGTFCGPCIHGIKQMKETRTQYKDHPDVAFVFITSDRESPIDKYNDFVKEQELIHTHRISSDDYLYLRQLFRFNGIPRYVLVDREGKIVDDNYSMHSFSTHIKELLQKN